MSSKVQAAGGLAPPRVLAIFNPTAGRRRRRLLHDALARLRAAGCQVTLQETTRRGDAEAFAARAAAAGHDVVLAAGGDGTINEAANGLPPDGPALAICPLGTANVIAGEIGLARDAAAVAAAVLAGAPRLVRPGLANGRRFLQMAGVGFDAHVVDAVHPVVKRRVGKTAYVVASLRQMFIDPFHRYRISADGQQHDCASAIISRGRFYAGRFTVAPQADLEAPDLALVLFPRGGVAGVLRYGSALLLDRIPALQDVQIVPAREIVVEAPIGDPVQGDGDIIAHLPLHIAIDAHHIRLLAPNRVNGIRG